PFSSLKFSKGRTAMLFSGIAARALVASAPGAGALVVGCEARWKRTKELITRATADTTKVTTSAILGERGALTGWTVDGCFHLFLRLSFSGAWGLPRLSL